ncbi:signal peptidase I [Cellulomonas sp. zg-ZUI222]|uniref:signal peptidase I n=1 Tax=Cellulomonas TaxID=1707 RepID=UPI001A94DB80|nr:MULTISPECIES: signal peptidase I [Cellulomonas]MBO0899654.1 signal peptidase I [Cellulomonas sp. zg-ZUI22]MBO0920516.1 signal peptidase I [Cellulomonas wangleii]
MNRPRPVRRRVLPTVLSVLSTAVVVVVLALAVALALVPRMLDGVALTVLTGSMAPTYEPGDVVVVRGVKDVPAEIEVGDVVSFQPFPEDPTLVTHRVVAIRSTSDGLRWVTRGDANATDDEPLRPEQIKAEVVYHVPAVGHVMVAVGAHRSTVVMAGAAVLLVYGAWMVLSPDRGRRPARADGAAGTDEAASDEDRPAAEVEA